MDKISEEQLKEIVSSSVSFCDACRRAGKKARGATLQFFTKRIKASGLDTSHFLGKAAHAGSRQTGMCKKKHWSEVLVHSSNGRERSIPLRRSFLEYSLEQGIKNECKVCGIKEWNKKPLKLELDHINENNEDNRPQNLQWLCPNCHSQKTFSGSIAPM